MKAESTECPDLSAIPRNERGIERHIILISGKDSLATAIVQIKKEPNLPYELVHNEVGWDLPETLEWIEQVGKYFQRPIIKCGDDLTEICYEQNCLPLAKIRRFCTKYAKIKPLDGYLGNDPAVVYFGLRADEPERAGWVVPPGSKQVPAYPLRDAGIDLSGVWSICSEADLLPPSFHWQWMEDRVRHLLCGDVYLLDSLNPWERRSLLAWRSRSNCDRCMYQRQYERVGLLEHHPCRFEDACQLEEKLCHRDEHTWVRGFRLREIPARAEKIKEKRARAIVKYLRSKQISSLWEDDSMQDELEMTSCGLLCGK